jgi:hypothetical protein
MAAEDAGPPPPALVLEAESGGMAGGVFVVGNKLPREVTAPVEVSAFVAPDHPEVKPTLRIEPERVVLQPGGQMLVQVWASVDDSLEADVSYRANVRVPGMSDEAIPLILRRRATAQVADSKVAASSRPGSARRGRRVQPARTVSKGT